MERETEKKIDGVKNWWRRRLEEEETGGEGVCWRGRLVQKVTWNKKIRRGRNCWRRRLLEKKTDSISN